MVGSNSKCYDSSEYSPCSAMFIHNTPQAPTEEVLRDHNVPD